MKSCLAFFLVFALSAIPAFGADVATSKSTAKPVADKWAVVVGIDKCDDGSWDFKYAESDAEKFKEYLAQDANFAPDHIKTLVGNQATQKNIQDAIFGWLNRASTSDDLVVIYIRTRGTYAKPSSKERNYLLASDTHPQSPDSRGIEMQSLVHKLVSTIHKGQTVLVIDSDFSPEVGQPLVFESFDLLSSDVFPPGSSLLVLWSNESDQIGWESDEYKSSFFTHDLIEEMKKNGPLAPIADAGVAVRERVKSEVEKAHHRLQEPGILWMSREYHQHPTDPVGSFGWGKDLTQVSIGGRRCKPRPAPE